MTAGSMIHPMTWQKIQTDDNPFDGRSYRCGCRPRYTFTSPAGADTSYHLCDYHDGYDDGCHDALPSPT